MKSKEREFQYPKVTEIPIKKEPTEKDIFIEEFDTDKKIDKPVPNQAIIRH